MTKKRKVFTLGLVILMVLASFPLMAYEFNDASNAVQNEPTPAKPMADGPTSPTNKASAGRFTTDVDNVLNLTGWSDVNKEGTWLGFAGWDNKLFSLGYARRIGGGGGWGGLYLGAWYNGNVVAAGEQDTEFVDVNYDSTGNSTYEITGYRDVTQPWVYSNNRLGILLGIAGMGIKLDVRENYLTKDLPLSAGSSHKVETNGTVTGTNEVSDYKYLKGWTDIYAGWGMAFPLGGGLSIKPTAQLGVQLYADDENTVKKVSATGESTYINIAATNQEGKNTSFVRPNILVGATLGGLPWGLGVGLEYGINFDIYTSSYDLYGGSESVAGTVSWGATNNLSFSNTTPTETTSITKGGVTITEKTQLQQIITPSLTYSTDLGDRVKFGLKFNLPFGINSKTSEGEYTKTWSTTVTAKTGGDTTVTETSGVSYSDTNLESETSVFTVSPALSIGTQVTAIPNKLTFNLGLTNKIAYSSEKTLTKPKGIGYTTTTMTTNGTTNTTKTVDSLSGVRSDTSTVKEKWTDLSAQISAGFTFYFSPNFLVDTYYTSSVTDEAGDKNTSSGISFGDTNFWDDVVDGEFALMFTIKK